MMGDTMKGLLSRVSSLALLVAVALGALATPGCGGPTQAGKLEVTYYYLPG